MTRMFKPAALAATAAALVVALPAGAQVNGIATAETPIAIASSQAFQTGYQQIDVQYEAQRQSITQQQQSYQQLVRPLDTNADGQVDDAELQATPQATVTQLQQLEQQIAQMQAPIQRARLYVVNQVAQQLAPAVQQVISERAIQLMISPDALIYAPDGADVTQAITAALNTRIPSVQITPPEGWQPTQATAQLFQQIQQLLVLSAMQQQQQQQGAAAQQPVEGR